MGNLPPNWEPLVYIWSEAIHSSPQERGFRGQSPLKFVYDILSFLVSFPEGEFSGGGFSDFP